MAKSHGRFRKKREAGGIIITSLIDIFTILMAFLMKNFAAEGNIVANAENLSLPNSDSRKRLTEVNLQVAVTHDMIVVDNVPVVPTKMIRDIPNDNPEPYEPKLLENLRLHYAQEEEMVRLGALNKVEGKVILQIDKNIPFDIMYKVMYTCGKVGYQIMNFAVMQREEE